MLYTASFRRAHKIDGTVLDEWFIEIPALSLIDSGSENEVEIIVPGDSAGPDSAALHVAEFVFDNLEALAQRATGLLTSFMKDAGDWGFWLHEEQERFDLKTGPFKFIVRFL